MNRERCVLPSVRHDRRSRTFSMTPGDANRLRSFPGLASIGAPAAPAVSGAQASSAGLDADGTDTETRLVRHDHYVPVDHRARDHGAYGGNMREGAFR